MKTKIIAYYLPQYHEIPENNEWWGEGFTEWKHVSEAKSLYNGHNQPRIPLNNNYYNLLDKKVMQWQTELSQKYGIYGFAYYHYWFNGKMLLEKPAENLLKWKDINQKFFFFWANHSWYKADNGKKTLLIEQTEGEKSDWKNHYVYMKQFFSDERYIKIDNRPVVAIYNQQMFKHFDEMIEFWNKLAKNDGFEGVYIIENKIKVNQKKKSKNSNALVCRQPLVAMNQYNLKLYRRVFRKVKRLIDPIPKKPQFLDYNIISKLERKYKEKQKEKEFLGISVGWDNTPRHKNFGQVFVNQTPETFGQTLYELLQKSERKGNELFFINAWNEWAEGMYLEPDTKNKYKYLEQIQNAINKVDFMSNRN